MKKFLYVLMAAVMTFSLAACDKNDVDSAADELSFVASIESAYSRIALEQAGNVWKAAWEGDESLVVESVASGAKFTFTNSVAEPNKFSCTAAGVSQLLGSQVKVYNEKASVIVNSALGADGMAVAGTTSDLAGGVALTAQCALLVYSAEEEVTFISSGDKGLFGDGKEAIYQVSMPAGVNVIVPVLAEGSHVLTYMVGSTSKEMNLAPEAGQVYNLGTLGQSTTVSATWGIAGQFQGWDPANATPMYEVDSYVVAYNLVNLNDQGFKIVKDRTWDVSYGSQSNTAITTGVWNSCGEANIIAPDASAYDVYFHPERLMYCVVTAGSVAPELGATPSVTWAVAGTFNDWGNTVMEATSESNVFVAKNIVAAEGNYFKVKDVNSWDNSWGGTPDQIQKLNADRYLNAYNTNGSDIYVAQSGTFDIYFEYAETASKIYLVTAGGDYKNATIQNENGPGPVDPTPSVTWAVAGTFNDWGNTVMEATSESNVFVAKNIVAAEGNYFKVKDVNSWDNSWGGTPDQIQKLNADRYLNAYNTNGSDIYVAQSGTFDIYFEYAETASKIYLVTAGGDYKNATIQNENGPGPVDPTPSVTWAVAGTFNDWGDTVMEATAESNVFVAKGIVMAANAEFKVKDSTTWEVSYGGSEKACVLNADRWLAGVAGGLNIVVAQAGTYDIYFEYGSNKIYLITAGGDYTQATEQREGLPGAPDVPSIDLAVAGSFNGWTDSPMSYEGQNIYALKGLALDAYAELKIKAVGNWDINYGGGIGYMNPNHYIVTAASGSNISITAAGTYDIYFDYTNLYLYVVTAGADYTSVPLQDTEGKEPTVDEPEGTSNVLYLKPNSNWLEGGARFSAYFWNAGGTNAWASMKDSDGDGIYEVNIPVGYNLGDNVIFCRMNPGTTANTWNNKWNQTGDLVIPTDGKNLYTVKAGTWDGSGNSEWSVK